MQKQISEQGLSDVIITPSLLASSETCSTNHSLFYEATTLSNFPFQLISSLFSDNTMMAPGVPNMQFSSTLPPPPPPPGCSVPDLPTFSTQLPSHTRGYQTQQQQQQHIVPPPPDLKPVVDKLAEYVARNGEEFEGQIRMKRDPRFDFLMSDHIYYPYYLYKKQHKIAEIAKKKAQEEKGQWESLCLTC